MGEDEIINTSILLFLFFFTFKLLDIKSVTQFVMFILYSISIFMCFRSTEECCRYFQKELEDMNRSKQNFVGEMINKIIGNTVGHIRYHFLDNNGPKYGTVTAEHAISVRYILHSWAC